MKNLILFVLMSFFIFGCTKGTTRGDTTLPSKNINEKYQNFDIIEYTYDGCQYVKFPSYNATWGSHKGNCNNPIHRQQRTIDIRFYQLDGSYEGYLPCDSTIVNYKKKRLEFYSQGKIVFLTELKDMGMFFKDLSK